MNDTALLNAKKAALVRINDFYSKTVEMLVGLPSQTEKDTWSLKLKIANDIAYSRILSKESLSYLNALNIDTVEKLSQFANTIISKAIMYSAVVGLADRLKTEAKEKIATIEDADGIEEIFIALGQKAALAIKELKDTPPNTKPMDISIDAKSLFVAGHDGVSQFAADENIVINFITDDIQSNEFIMSAPLEVPKFIYREQLVSDAPTAPLIEMILNKEHEVPIIENIKDNTVVMKGPQI